MAYEDHIVRYLDGISLVRASVEGLSTEQLTTRCEPGAWSIHEVVCHLADFEIVYTDRIKCILAEDNPPLPGRNPDDFANTLAYDSRSLENELKLIDAVRTHTAEILRTISSDQWEFMGTHSVDGPISVVELVERITDHLHHHLKFIREKKERLGAAV
jgi:uncharacterized damage-inducible protein DinB